MLGRHRWVIGLATSTGILGLTVTSGLVLLAQRFVDEFSRPHEHLDQEQFNWGMPTIHTEPAATYRRRLIIQTRDGKLLRGDFWAQPQPAPTVIMCHGYRVPSAHLRPAAALSYHQGYNVLLFDFRGHGESESVITSGGYIEVLDLEAAIAAAGMQKETLPGRIVLHGFSMGASIALLLPPHPDVVAIIADSPYARADEILQRLVLYRLTIGIPSAQWLRSVLPAVTWATVATSDIVFRLRYGHTCMARPITSFKRHKTSGKKAEQSPRQIPILLIHSAGDDLIPITHAQRLTAEAQAHGVPLETYFVDSGGHCGAYGYDPEKYTSVIRLFLLKHLKDDFPGKSNEVSQN